MSGEVDSLGPHAAVESCIVYVQFISILDDGRVTGIGPLAQTFDGIVKGRVVKNYELEIAQSLIKNATNAVVKKRKGVVDGHYNADERVGQRIHKMTEALV